METENSKSKEGLIQSQIVMPYILQGPISKFRSAGKSDKSVETLLHDIASFLLVVLNLISSFRDGEHLMFLGDHFQQDYSSLWFPLVFLERKSRYFSLLLSGLKNV